MTKDLNEVRHFWEENPLFSGEAKNPLGTKGFFEEHRNVYINDCFAGTLDDKLFPEKIKNEKILDLGCGVGMWATEFGLVGYANITAADLTISGLLLTRQRAAINDIKLDLCQANAEKLPLKNATFSHVNCQGVIHHTPNTAACVEEIARVLQKNGTAIISVYYRNIFLRLWPLFKWVSKIVYSIGGKLRGRGRDGIFNIDDPDEVVRLYDGKLNPIGKSYSKKKIIELLTPAFVIEEIFYHFFPARALPFKIPKFIHKVLDQTFPFMIFVKLRKK